MSAALASSASIHSAETPRPNLLARAAAAVAAHFANDRAARELASFDDRMLADIGLTRGDIRGALARAPR